MFLVAISYHKFVSEILHCLFRYSHGSSEFPLQICTT